MGDIFQRLWENLTARVTGPMNFRLLVQPLVATGIAVWSGIKDARDGRPPFLSTIIRDPVQRPALLRHAWKDVGKVFSIAVILDVIYQLIQHRGVYFLELLIVAPTLALIPYVLFRGPVNRIAKEFVHRAPSQ